MIKALVFSTIISIFPIYQIRLLREHIQSKFVFGDEDTARWHLTIAKKRIQDKHQNEALKHQQQAKKYIDDLRDKTDINFLTDFYKQNQLILDTWPPDQSDKQKTGHLI